MNINTQTHINTKSHDKNGTGWRERGRIIRKKNSTLLLKRNHFLINMYHIIIDDNLEKKIEKRGERKKIL